MKARLVLVVVIFATLSTVANAQVRRDRGYGYVDAVQVSEDNYLYISVQGDFDAPFHGGCTNGAWARSRFPLTDARTELASRLASASLLSGHPVHIYTQGCTISPATPGFPIFYGLQVNRP